ncbi:MAG: hypothetical protein D6B25_13780 [Desulfobulbaceae bacterium]|nr:MAG: hypothetical protein D6B25_13780 [Desulfobulbaceae bacterium]
MITLFRHLVSTLIILSLIIVPVGNATAFSVGEEREVGEKLLYAVRASFTVMGDPDIQQYIDELGAEVLKVAGIQYFDYRFYIVESKEFNAFAAPSGLIFFYSKLIESMHSEDELVSVLAHEIGHVVKRHLASRMEKGTAVSIASLGLALAAIALGGGGAATGALVAGSMAANQSAQLHFSREDEVEADLLAYQWLKAMGRDPEGQLKMLETMRRITRYRSGQVPQYLLTHPNPEARMEYVESLISAERGEFEITANRSDFEFLRFKYRIMSESSSNAVFRAYLVNKITGYEADSIETTMAWYGLSQLDKIEKNYDRAMINLEKVMAKFPGSDLLQVDKALIYKEMGKTSQALKMLKEVVEADPFNMFATYHYAQILHGTGESEKARNLLGDVAVSMPEYSKVYYDIGKIYADEGKEPESRFYLGKYNLYEGKLKLATFNFTEASKNSKTPTELVEQSKEYLELIKRLKK